jgi:hypothetical protein
MRGWLLKRKKGSYDPRNKTSPLTSILGSFNRRYFWIDSSIRLIYYSESEDRSKRVSFIPFNKLVSVTPVTEPLAINSAKPGWVYGIELRTTDRVYELWARTPSEAKQWLEVLDKAASIGARQGVGAFNLSAVRGNESNGLPGSRRGSNSSHGGAISSIGAETATTVPVVAAGPKAISDDTLTVVVGGKENFDMARMETVRSPQGAIKTTSIVAAATGLPSKWDDWATSHN